MVKWHCQPAMHRARANSRVLILPFQKLKLFPGKHQPRAVRSRRSPTRSKSCLTGGWQSSAASVAHCSASWSSSAERSRCSARLPKPSASSQSIRWRISSNAAKGGAEMAEAKNTLTRYSPEPRSNTTSGRAVAVILKPLIDLHGEPRNWATAAPLYMKALADIPPKLLALAVNHAIASNPYFPKPADLRASIVDELRFYRQKQEAERLAAI